MNSDSSTNRLQAVNLRLQKLGVRLQDIDEQFIHSGGKGGQNVNKVSTAVRLMYRGEEVKCMQERSQYLNRIKAREILAARLEKNREDARLFAQANAQRMRREKEGRPKAVKRRILKDKRANSRLKKNRSWRQGNDD
jgi:protein subunit release factor B